MYFKEKEDTNIDGEFESNNKINFDLKKIKPILLIVGGILLIGIIIFIVISLFNKGPEYAIVLEGSQNITIALGQQYIEPGYKAYDKNNKDVTEQVEVTNNVDSSKVGEYEVLYSLGNVKAVRYVTVAENESETFIRLEGKVNMYLKVGEKYIEPGYKVYDSIDNNLTEKVIVTGTVDTSKAGTYQLTYSVTNSRNITTTVKRTIIVTEK